MTLLLSKVEAKNLVQYLVPKSGYKIGEGCHWWGVINKVHKWTIWTPQEAYFFIEKSHDIDEVCTHFPTSLSRVK